MSGLPVELVDLWSAGRGCSVREAPTPGVHQECAGSQSNTITTPQNRYSGRENQTHDQAQEEGINSSEHSDEIIHCTPQIQQGIYTRV